MVPKDLSNIGDSRVWRLVSTTLTLDGWSSKGEGSSSDHPPFFGHGVKGGHLEEVPQPAGPTLVDPNHRLMNNLNSSIRWFCTDGTMGFIPRHWTEICLVGEFFSFYCSKSPFFTTIWQKIFGSLFLLHWRCKSKEVVNHYEACGW